MSGLISRLPAIAISFINILQQMSVTFASIVLYPMQNILNSYYERRPVYVRVLLTIDYS